jgi:hypothetical protein
MLVTLTTHRQVLAQDALGGVVHSLVVATGLLDEQPKRLGLKSYRSGHCDDCGRRVCGLIGFLLQGPRDFDPGFEHLRRTISPKLSPAWLVTIAPTSPFQAIVYTTQKSTSRALKPQSRRGSNARPAATIIA